MPEAFFLATAEADTPAEAAGSTLQAAKIDARRLDGAVWGAAGGCGGRHLNLPGLKEMAVSCGAASSLAAVQVGVQTLLCENADLLLVGGEGGNPIRSAGLLIASANQVARLNWMPRGILRAFRWTMDEPAPNVWKATCVQAGVTPDEVERVWSDGWLPEDVAAERAVIFPGVQGAVMLARLLAELERTGESLGVVLVTALDGVAAAAILERI